MNMEKIELLLMHAEEERPVLEDGLPFDAASGAPRPKERPSLNEEWILHNRHTGGDPSSLPDQRWGLLVPEGAEGERLLEIVAPLKKAREEQQGAEAIVYRAPAGMASEDAATWWSDVYLDEGIHDEDRPRYLLMLGDADLLSWDLQQRLGSDAFMGRICFPDEAGYEAYVHKLLAFEREELAPGARALYYTVHDGTAATNLGYDALMTPTIEQTRLGHDNGAFNAREILEIGGGENITADDLAARAFLPGGMWFYSACFGAGTPTSSAYHHWLAAMRDVGLSGSNIDCVLHSLPGEKGRPFVAALPQAALANPNGPLAFMGHVDLAWTYSFYDAGRTNRYRPSRFQDVFRSILGGKRVGAGYFELQRFFNQASVDLGTLFDEDARTRARGGEINEDKARKSRKAALWMLRQDLSAYVLLGDPAARLHIAEPLPAQRPLARATAATAPRTSKLDPRRVEEAVFATLDSEALDALAARLGVTRAELDRWLSTYKEGGRAAVERLG
jgi:hypothetical protein